MVIEYTKHVYMSDDGEEFDSRDLAENYEQLKNFKNFIQYLGPKNVDIYYIVDWKPDSIEIEKLWEFKDEIVRFLIENKYININKIMEE